MIDRIIIALEKWQKNNLNLYHWFNREEIIEMAELINDELTKGQQGGSE